MIEQQRRQAVHAMSALVLSWLQRRRYEQANARRARQTDSASNS